MAAESIVLGSASPRRAELLARLGVAFEQRSIEIDEGVHEIGTDVGAIVEATAFAKFEALVSSAGDDTRRVLTSDTLVSLDGSMLSKPDDDADVASMLRRVSGRSVDIATAVVVGVDSADAVTDTVITRVALRSITDEEIADYVASGIGRGKAGALSLQDGAAPFIDRLERCWSNVVGLPVCAVAALLDLDDSHRSAADRCKGPVCGSDADVGAAGR